MNRKSLVDTLELVGMALADTNLVPVFQNFMFTGRTVIAYNDVVGIIAPCEQADAFAVNGKTLLGLLSHSKAEDITFTVEPQEVLIKTGRSTFKLPWLPKEDFLFEEPKEKWVVNTKFGMNLTEALGACLTTSSRSNAQPALMGVCIKNGILYSCDGDALSRAQVAGKSTTHPQFTMPNAFCEAVLKVHADTEANDGTLSLNDNWAAVEFDNGYVIYGRIIDNKANPLDHEALIVKTLKAKPTYVAVPKGLKDALARARVVADPESAKTVLTVKEGRLRLVTETHMGVVRDTLPFKHPEAEASVSAEVVQRSITLCDEMSILSNCTTYKSGDKLLVLVSNMG